MSTTLETTVNPRALVGTFRRFKNGGPVYEVVEIKQGSIARIRVVESGEELDYPIAKVVADDAE